jgi:hypothetical protein
MDGDALLQLRGSLGGFIEHLPRFRRADLLELRDGL